MSPCYTSGKPKFTPDGAPKDITVNEGNDATFSCITEAKPTATIEWYINTGRVTRELNTSFLAFSSQGPFRISERGKGAEN